MAMKSSPSNGSAPTDALRLFAYGTLRDPAVQHRLFGRTLAGEPDALAGYAIGSILIARTLYPILRPASAADIVTGVALAITSADLAAADSYEGPDYVRIAITLRSGRAAFVYVARA